MPAPLSAEHLMRHVRALTDEIALRPAGHPEEDQARAYVREHLQDFGYDEIETLPFPAPDTWSYSMIYPVLLVLASNGLGCRKRAGRLLGGLLALTDAYFFWKATGSGRHPLTKLAPRRPSATLIARVPPTGGPYVDGANDNASAVACALGLAERLKTEPLEHTEVWLAFTGAEEIGCLGTHALLDAYSETLRDTWFLDFEMVGTDEIAYVTLRSRGYRGLCLAGFGDDGWLANWHQTIDDTAHLVSAGLEKATTFAWRMLHALEADPM